MADIKDDINNSFLAALTHSIAKIGYGSQRKIAAKAGISQQYISGILSGKRFGKEDKRRLIADACGYEYEDFLKLGKNLLRCEQPPGTKKLVTTFELPFTTVEEEENSDVTQTETNTRKGGDVMGSGDSEIVAHYKSEVPALRAELAAVREEIKYLRESYIKVREERDWLLEELKYHRDLLTRQTETEKEKKTAV